MVSGNFLPEGLRLEQMSNVGQTLILSVSTTQSKANCPKCGVTSAHIHSRYTRVVKDLPCLGLTVCLRLQTHRFFCLNLNCQQRIFCQRLSAVVSARGRFSLRLNQLISFIGLANGGQMGARLASRLSIEVSPDTLLRRIRSINSDSTTTVRVLGIDDWALRKGQRYGTILVDLERHCPIDLLPDRNSDTVADWLKLHPEIEIISRDRANSYIDAANKGAPQAIQVADRFHLLQNLTDAVERFLKSRTKYLKEAAEAIETIETINTQSTPAQLSPLTDQPSTEVVENTFTTAESAEPLRQDQRYERYLQVRALHQQGASIQTIAKHFGMHRRTVRLFIRAQTYPERVTPQPRGSMLNKYTPYLKKRWEEGCHSATQLWRELRAQGFRGARSNVCRYLTKYYREELPLHIRQMRNSKPQQAIPSTRNIAWLFGQKPKDLKPEQEVLITKLCEISTEAKLVYELSQSFSEMLREKKPDSLEQWLADANKSGIVELSNFADGLGREQASIEAAITLPWSNGQVEGTVNRLKLLKRQMYGRAKLDLLRQRVLNKGST